MEVSTFLQNFPESFVANTNLLRKKYRDTWCKSITNQYIQGSLLLVIKSSNTSNSFVQMRDQRPVLQVNCFGQLQLEKSNEDILLLAPSLFLKIADTVELEQMVIQCHRICLKFKQKISSFFSVFFFLKTCYKISTQTTLVQLILDNMTQQKVHLP